MVIATLDTPRLTLRAFAPDDWDAFNETISDSEAMQYMHFSSWNEEQRREWFESCIATGQAFSLEGKIWAIVLKEPALLIGYFGIGTSTDPENAYDINFGYALARQHWNQGYMTEALLAVFGHEFDVLCVPQLSANCQVPNVGSARAMEKAGMHRYKTESGIDMEGNWAENHHYVITREKWDSRKSE